MPEPMTDPTPRLFPEDVLNRARSLFPHTQTGRIYLNHAATSPLSSRVTEAIQRHLTDRSAGMVETYRDDVATIEACREVVHRFIHAESPDRMAFVCNTSDGLNVVSSGLPWRSGDRILLNDMEFPANVHPYFHLRAHGVHLDILKADRGRVTPEMIGRSIRPHTRVVALSAVQYLTGHRADLAAIGALCRKRGVWFVVDGIQAVGAIPIDVQAMKIDAMSAGAQKWQMSPHGSGFLYISEPLQAALRQQYVGWLSVADPWQFSLYDQPLASSAKRYEGGTLNFPSIIGMKAALETLLEFSVDSIESHILALTARLRDGLLATGMFTLVTPEADGERAGIMTFAASDGRDLTPLLTALQERRIDCSLREGKLRFSPHFYNSPMEIDATIAAVREILGRK
jgi:selenocysteine lyase/cysteine desulfurase